MIRDYSNSVIRAARKQAHEIIDQFCAEMVMASADEAPHDTGNLAETITHDVKELNGRVYTQSGKKGGGEGYGWWVHEGTSRMKPNRFFQRGFERTKAAQ